MNFLYVSNVNQSKQFSGIFKKVKGQTNGVAKLGWNAHYTCIRENCVLCCDASGRELQKKPIAQNLHWRMQQKVIAQQICSFLEETPYDVLYIKGFLATPYAFQVASFAKRVSPTCRVIFEIATYPYWGEYKRFFRVALQQKNLRAFSGHLLEVLQHLLTAPRMRRAVDTLAVFGKPVSKLWGIPAITIDNGVSVEQIPLRNVEKRETTIALLGVVGTSIAHGYERILQGLANHQKKNPSQKICFAIVGNNETIVDLKRLAQKLQVENAVCFLGYKNRQELTELYAQYDAAVSSLGVYKIGLTYLCPLKSREYCAAGIPFLYAYEDTLPDEVPFARKLPNDPSPVDMEAVISFVEQCRSRPNLAQEERQFAKQHYDWQVIMQRVLQFTLGSNPKNH